MGRKAKHPSGPFTDWYEVEAWFTEAGELREIAGKMIEIKGEIEEVPVVEVGDSSMSVKELQQTARNIREATGLQPLIFNGPIHLLRLKRLRDKDYKRLRARLERSIATHKPLEKPDAETNR